VPELSEEHSHQLQAVVSSGDRQLRLTVSGDIDLASIAVLRDVLYAAIQTYTNDVVVDLSGVTFCDSVGLCELLAARRQLDESCRHLRVIDASRPMRRLFELSGTADLFTPA
jgi:anti-sigma B factor antagonist